MTPLSLFLVVIHLGTIDGSGARRPGRDKAEAQIVGLHRDILVQGPATGAAVDRAKALIRAGVEHSIGHGHQTALMLASYRGHEGLVTELLDHGASVNAQHTINAAGSSGQTALYHTLAGWHDRNKYNHGLSVQEQVKHGFLRFEQVFSLLLDAGADTGLEDYAVVLYAARVHALWALKLMLRTSNGCVEDLQTARAQIGGSSLSLLHLLIESTRWVKFFGHMYLKQKYRKSSATSLLQHDSFETLGFDHPKQSNLDKLNMSMIVTQVQKWTGVAIIGVVNLCGAEWLQGFSSEEDNNGNSATHMAAYEGNEVALTIMGSHGLLSIRKNKWGQSPCHTAAFRGFADLIDNIFGVSNNTSDCLHHVDTYRRTVMDVGTPEVVERLSYHLTLASSAPVYSRSSDCDFDSINGDQLDVAQFQMKYLSIDRPVRIVGATLNWPAQKLWSFQYISNTIGDVQVQVSNIPYGSNFNKKLSKMTVKDFLNYHMPQSDVETNENLYLFNSNILKSSPELLKSVKVPLWFQGLRHNPPQLIIGGKGSGSPWHFHQSAWNALFRGTKQWSILPATSLAMVSDPVTSKHSVGDGVLRCTQRAGDILFIPGGFSHMVQNVDAVIGIAIEIY